VLYLREREALVEQARLRGEAERARSEEARLRNQAQARANFSRVAVLLSEGKIKEADALLKQNPLESIDPSSEAAGVFRSLGSWNAVYGRWEQASQCFTLLNQANRFDSRSNVLEGLDLLFTAPAYLERGDLRGYKAFRREAMDRYLPVRNSLEAEHLLKACLLAPADAAMLERLKQVAEMCEKSVPANPGWTHFREWEAFSLALYHHRRGEPEKVLEWCRESLKAPDLPGSRTTAILCLTAMAHKKLGQPEEASADLDKARKAIPPPPDPNDESPRSLPGTWLSWSVARLLFAEAEKTVF
jgi:tetratricopeptide (TPR) repeat protein